MKLWRYRLVFLATGYRHLTVEVADSCLQINALPSLEQSSGDDDFKAASLKDTAVGTCASGDEGRPSAARSLTLLNGNSFGNQVRQFVD